MLHQNHYNSNWTEIAWIRTSTSVTILKLFPLSCQLSASAIKTQTLCKIPSDDTFAFKHLLNLLLLTIDPTDLTTTAMVEQNSNGGRKTTLLILSIKSYTSKWIQMYPISKILSCPQKIYIQKTRPIDCQCVSNPETQLIANLHFHSFNVLKLIIISLILLPSVLKPGFVCCRVVDVAVLVVFQPSISVSIWMSLIQRPHPSHDQLHHSATAAAPVVPAAVASAAVVASAAAVKFRNKTRNGMHHRS